MDEREMLRLMMGDMYNADDSNSEQDGKREADEQAQNRAAPAKVKDSPLPEQVEKPKAAAVEVVSTVEAVAAGWGMLPGEVDVVADMAWDRFPGPPIDGRAFPHFPTFCAGYGKGCQTCRFFHYGRGPFCLVWGAAWPKFQRDAETDTATW